VNAQKRRVVVVPALVRPATTTATTAVVVAAAAADGDDEDDDVIRSHRGHLLPANVGAFILSTRLVSEVCRTGMAFAFPIPPIPKKSFAIPFPSTARVNASFPIIFPYTYFHLLPFLFLISVLDKQVAKVVWQRPH